MCGIWGLLGSYDNVTNLFDAYNNIMDRGPDRSEFFQWHESSKIFQGFHRLSIMDKTVMSDQPFVHENNDDKVIMACNGEIYNYKELTKEHDLPVRTTSDCEVIIWLYIKYGFKKMVELLNGEFAIDIMDVKKKDNTITLYLARDHCGIRPMFVGETETAVAWSSELKGLTHNMGKEDVG